MAPVVRVRFLGDKSDFDSAASAVEDRGTKLGSVLQGVFQGFGQIAGQQIIRGVGAGVDYLKGAVGAASDLAETVSKVGVLFGDAAPEIEKWASNAASAMGQSKQQALDASATFATFGKSAGLSGKDLAAFAEQNTQLASDLASFNNTSPEEAIQAIGSALRGEAEPMRRYGVLLDDASMRNKALAMGLISTTKDALTPQQKVLAAQALIMEQTGAAQGDFARTSDGLANKSRILSAKMTDLKTKIGEGLLPIVLKLATVFSDKVLPVLEEVGGGVRAFFMALSDPSGGRTTSGLAGAFEQLGLWVGKFFEMVQAFWPKVKDVFGAIGDAIRLVVGTFTGAGADVQGHGKTFINTFIDIGAAARDWFDRLKLIFDGIVTVVQTVVGYVVTAFQQQWPAIQAVVQQVVAVIQERIAAMKVIFTDIITWLQANWPTIQAIIQPVIDGIVQIIVLAVDIISQLFHLLTETVMFLWSKWGDDMLAVVSFLLDHIVPIVQGLVDVIVGIVRLFKDILHGDWGAAWNDLVGIFSAAWDVIRGVISAAFDGLKNLLGKIGEFAASIITTLKDGLVNHWQDVVSWLNGIPEMIVHAVGDLSRILFDVGKDIIRGLLDGIESMIGSLTDKLKKVTDLIPFHKGPISVDRKLLEPSGRAIMHGLMAGIDSQVAPLMGRLGGITGAIGGIGPGTAMAARAPGLNVGGVAVTENDLVMLVVDGARRFQRERA